MVRARECTCRDPNGDVVDRRPSGVLYLEELSRYNTVLLACSMVYSPSVVSEGIALGVAPTHARHRRHNSELDGLNGTNDTAECVGSVLGRAVPEHSGGGRLHIHGDTSRGQAT